MQREGMIGFAALLTLAVLSTGDGRDYEGAASAQAQDNTMISEPAAAAPELRRTSPGNAIVEGDDATETGKRSSNRLRFHVSVSL